MVVIHDLLISIKVIIRPAIGQIVDNYYTFQTSDVQRISDV